MKQQKNHFSHKAFTLVELIVVITILAILGTIAFISFSGYSQDARNSTRVADIKTIEKSLQIYSTRNDKYPEPQDGEIVSYSGETVYLQGTFGSSPYKEVGNLSNIPVDPLTKTEYIYSTTNNQTEYEILAIYEGQVVNNSILNQTHAAETYKPKVSGTYNHIYVKTNSFYIPLPSLINSEVSSGNPLDLKTSPISIDSFVVTNGDNIPNVGNTDIETQTGQLSINLSAYEGTISSTSSNTDKENLAKAIQLAYSGTTLQTQARYSNILNKTTTEELVALVDNVVLGKASNLQPSNGGGETAFDISVCSGKNTGDIVYEDGTIDGSTLTCDDNIAVCNGTGTGYIISACNVGATIAGTDWTDTSTIGKHFQWGRNDGFDYNGGADPSATITLYNGTSHVGGGIDLSGNPTYANKFIIASSTYSYNWLSKTGETSDPIWGQGPCSTGYRVPTYTEWSGMITAGGWGSDGASMQTALKMPYSGYRDKNYGSFFQGGGSGFYRSSSPNGSAAINLSFLSDSIGISPHNYRSHGYSVRCFKN